MAMGQGLQNLLQSPMAGGQQQSPDPSDMVSQLVAQFTQHLQKQKEAGKLTASQGISEREGAGQLRTAAGERAATSMQQAGQAAAEPWKPQALDIALIAASVAGPIIAAMQPEGRGRRGRRKQERMSNLFQGLSQLAQKGVGLRMGSFEAGKEATFGAAETRADMSIGEAEAQYGRTIGGIGAERKALESDRTYDLGVRRENRMASQPERGATWSDLKLKGFGGLSGSEQKDALYPGLAEPKPTGLLTENQREKSRQQDVLDRANAHLYSLDHKMRERAGIKYDIDTFPKLADAAQALANYKEPTGLFGWGEGQAAPDSTLYDLMIEYMGQGSGGGETPLTPEEKAELEARRQR